MPDEPTPIETAAAAIVEASTHPTVAADHARKAVGLSSTLDLAIGALKAVDAVYLPAMLQVLETLRNIVPD